MKITDPILIDRYYDTLVNRDEDYISVYVVGVKTTGIFCVSICSARKPKKENCEFFSELADGLRYGYRPCKVCQPASQGPRVPKDVLTVLEWAKDAPMRKVNDQMLRDHDISPDVVRRYFKSRYGITYQAYLRMQRINAAYESLRKGKTIAEVALAHGYESISGFGYAFKEVMGYSPKKLMHKTTILIQRLTTPIGPMYVCATERGVCLLEFTDRRMLETEFVDLQKRLDAVILFGRNQHIDQLTIELQEYFEGKRTKFDVALDTPTTPFRQTVWEVLKRIPYGETTTYGLQATSLGKHSAVRAVASANGHNRVAIVIPCHRVIGADGSLTGYAGGLERKRWLLDHERRHAGVERQGELF